MTYKVHTWRGNYQRVFGIGHGAIVHLGASHRAESGQRRRSGARGCSRFSPACACAAADPSTWTETNRWTYDEVAEVKPVPDSATDFNLTVRAGRKTNTMKFRCDEREQLLTVLMDRWLAAASRMPPQRLLSHKVCPRARAPHACAPAHADLHACACASACVQLARGDVRKKCLLEAGPSSLMQLTEEQQVRADRRGAARAPIARARSRSRCRSWPRTTTSTFARWRPRRTTGRGSWLRWETASRACSSPQTGVRAARGGQGGGGGMSSRLCAS